MNNVAEIPKKQKEGIYCGECQSSVDKQKLTKGSGADTLSVQEKNTSPINNSHEVRASSAPETSASKMVLKRNAMQKPAKDPISGEYNIFLLMYI